MKITIVAHVGPVRLPPNLEQDFTFVLTEAMKALELTDVLGEVRLSFFPMRTDDMTGFGEYRNETRVYGININPVKAPTDFGEVVQLICHDLVHVKQMTSGRLKFEGRVAIWDGQRYENYSPDDGSLPWERDADDKAEEVYITVSREKAAKDGVNFNESVLH